MRERTLRSKYTRVSKRTTLMHNGAAAHGTGVEGTTVGGYTAHSWTRCGSGCCGRWRR